jgi:hypothetical protein
MDLREKPGKIQKMLELFLRFRLISVLLLVAVSAFLVATRWQAMVSMPVASSESMGMWLAEHEGLAALWQGGQYLAVSALSLVVLLFVFTGVRGGIAGLLGLCAFVFALFALGGAESMVLVFFGVFAGLALLLLFVVKHGVACSLFPFALCWVFLTGIISIVPSYTSAFLVWAVLSAIGFSTNLAFSVTSGALLAEGTPQAGALVRSGKKILVPVVVSSLLAVAALFLDMDKTDLFGKKIALAVGSWVIFNLWFYAFLFPLTSFAPWEKLRSKERRVKMKEKKK